MRSDAGPAGWAISRAFIVTDLRILWRMRTPLIFLFAVPALLSVLLGPAVAGGEAGFPGRSVIGFAVMFSFMTINYAGLALFREFSSGTWMRQATHRPSRTAFLLGKTLPVMLAGLLQLCVFGALVFAVYPLPLHGEVVQLLLVAVPLSWCGPLVGVLLYNVTRSVASFQSVTYLVMMGAAGIGGSIVVPELLPVWTRLGSPATPHYWAMKSFTESTVGGGSWRPVLTAAAVLSAMALSLAVAAFVTFDYRREKLALE